MDTANNNVEATGYLKHFPMKRLWAIFAVAMVASFSVLLLFGGYIYQKAPPVPEAVVTKTGGILYSKADILEGQRVWQSMGGMEMGSVWGHGSYLAPDWTADWLHREALALADIYARQEYGRSYDGLDANQQAYVQAMLKSDMRANTHDVDSGEVSITGDRAEAIRKTQGYYMDLFASSTPSEPIALDREHMALPAGELLTREQGEQLSAFFFWTAWSAVTNRPGEEISYTSNWPHEKLVGNTPSAPVFIWSFISIVLLICGIAALCAYYAWQYDKWRDDLIPREGISEVDVFANVVLTPSMRATIKYFVVVVALILVQVTLGAITAHYAVEGQDFYGIPLADLFPYALTRTWHVQSALFWIATSWLAAGLFLAPLISGHEPEYQRHGVNFLFVSLLIIVVGSFIGQWLAVVGRVFENMGINFWFGHQGYEYIDLGRFWQIFLFIGLLLWLVLMGRALWPALQDEKTEGRHLLTLLMISAVAIGLLYGAGLFWGSTTHLSMVEYWRWWVVHLWVEGVFEVFATAIIAVLFVKMGLLRSQTAAFSVIFAALIFLSGGVLGTFHHLYWSGTPIGVLALGGVFSALEVVPLAVIGFEAFSHFKLERLAGSWIERYRWPLSFLLAVSVWNVIGAGVLGFLINPPLALYYLQGLNTTPVHAHAALFGVYGMLGIGLTLFCLAIATKPEHWNQKLLQISFWSFNIGLAAMVFISLLPQGILQAIESFSVGYWSARTPEFMHQPLMETFVWLRVPGDIIFTVGIVTLAWFTYDLLNKTWKSRKTESAS